MLPTLRTPSHTRHCERGFTLVELLVSMAITTVIIGSTMAAMNDAIKATDGAMLLTNLNNGLRTSMDLIVRDMLQVGQGLPSGRIVTIPSGIGALGIRLPGPPGTNLTLPANAAGLPTDFSAVVPGPGLGPVINGVATDIITTLQADSAFDGMDLTRLISNAAGASEMDVSAVLPPPGQTGGGADFSTNGPDNVRKGDLIMLTKSSFSVLLQVSDVGGPNGQTVFFNPGDSLRLNQGNAAENGSLFDYLAVAPSDAAPVAGTLNIESQATRIRMITYYIDGTDLLHPRLVRRIGNGDPVTFDNTLGTAVAFDIENLQITYDLADGVTNPSNVRMLVADQDGTGRCAPDPCSRNNIRKVNIVLSGRSRLAMKGTRQFLRNRLQTQVSLRSLAFVDKY